MTYENLGLEIPEPPDGTCLVAHQEKSKEWYGPHHCPTVLWRDDARGRHFHPQGDGTARWFRNEEMYSPMQWGEAMRKVVAVFRVDVEPYAHLP